MLKKLFIFLLVFLVGFSVITPAFADDNGIENIMTEFCNRRDSNVVNLEQWYSGKCNGSDAEKIGFSNIVMLDLYEKISGNSKSTQMQPILKKIFGGQVQPSDLAEISNISKNAGLIGLTSNIIGNFYQYTPASSLDYIADVRNNIENKHLIQPAYAQAATNGYGFNSLQALLPIWKIFRNLAYFLFTLVFVVYGFMIMFRVKLSAQTVISFQSAIPRIVVTLLSITFSYAIAGFLIDMFYVIVGMVFSLLKMGNPAVITNESNAYLLSGMSVGLFGPALGMLVHLLSLSLFTKIIAFVIPQAWGVVAGGVLAVITTITGSWILLLIFALIIGVAVLFTMFRIAWMLLVAVVTISIKIMFAPILLLKGILPTKGNAFIDWMKSIVAELAILGVTIFGFLFAFYFIGPVTYGVNVANSGAPLLEIGSLDTSKDIWIGPPLGINNVNLGGSATGKFAVIGLGIFLMIPKFADMVRKAFGTSGAGFGSDIGVMIMGGDKTAIGQLQAGAFGRIPKAAGGLGNLLSRNGANNGNAAQQPAPNP